MSVETDPAPEPEPEMSKRTMVLLAGAMSVCVALVLGVTLLVGGERGGGPPAGAAAGTVPAMEGRSLVEATRALADRRLPVGGVSRVPSSLPAGHIVYTAPAPGTPVPEGSLVTLYVSDGSGGAAPENARAAVPYLVGVDAGLAARVLAALGLRLDPAGAKGRITAQDPAPGTEVAGRTKVRVTVEGG